MLLVLAIVTAPVATG